MRLIEITNLNDKVYLIPLGDLHLGAPNIDLDKFKGYLNWVKEHEAYIFLMGDLFDVATLNSRTKVFDQKMTLNEAMRVLSELLTPVKDKVIGAITGNHESRLEKYAGFNPLESFAYSFGIPYAGYSAVIRFRVGKYERKNGLVSPRVEYIFYAHHTTGGGATLGGKLNRVTKLVSIFQGADCYLGGHNHSKALGEDSVAYLSKSGNGKAAIQFKRVMYVDSGSFLDYNDSYAEELMLPPSHTGAPRLRMSGIQKDLHISY